MRTTRVMVVDDSAFFRRTLSGMLRELPGVEVVATATDGLEAIQSVGRLHPDLITLDLEMPRMDGFAFLQWLMRTAPTPVLVISSASHPANIFQALELGAMDFIAKPTRTASWNIMTVQDELHKKVRSIVEAVPNWRPTGVQQTVLRPCEPSHVPGTHAVSGAEGVKLVAIGSSTGGPQALQAIIGALPNTLPCSVVISQHMPAGFTASFAERLNRTSAVDVSEAKGGERCLAGRVLVCPGGTHLEFSRKGDIIHVELRPASEDEHYVPSVDRMMASAADTFGGDVVGIILTGMGHDGRRGMARIKSRGGFTIVESEETAVVFGMPNEAIKEGVVDVIVPLHRIVETLVRYLTVAT